MQIGNVTIESRLALAPMAGVTDPAFRQICSELGAGYTVTELISSKALCFRDKKTETLVRPFEGEHPFAVQIFGSDPSCMAEAAAQAPKWFTADQNLLFSRLWNGWYKTGSYFADQLNKLSRNFAHEKSVG